MKIPQIIPDLRNKPPSISINYYPHKEEHLSTTTTKTTTEKWRVDPPPVFSNLPKFGLNSGKFGQKFGQKTTSNRRNYFPTTTDDFPARGSNVRPVTVDFARPSYNRRNEENINLNTGTHTYYHIVSDIILFYTISFLLNRIFHQERRKTFNDNTQNQYNNNKNCRQTLFNT